MIKLDKKAFQIHLDPELIEDFDELIDAEEHITMQKVFTSKKYQGINAWDCIYSCDMRIRNTIKYLNELELGSMHGYGNAFDFADFMNNASVVISCVDMLANIFEVSLETPNSKCDIFAMKGNDGEGTDRKYFEFIRSLCIVHPVETNRHQSYQGAEFVTCPYIVWTDPITRGGFNNCDLHANALVNESCTWGTTVKIYIDQIFKYVEYRYGLLKLVNKALYEYQQRVVLEFIQASVNSREPVETEQEYILRLKEEDLKRFGSYDDYIFDFVIDLMEFQPINPINKPAIERYKNAWRYSLELERNAMNSMDRTGCSNSGTDAKDGWTLFENLIDPHSQDDFFKRYHYQIEKFHYLDGRHERSDEQWGYFQFNELKSAFPPSICIDDDLDNQELYILGLTALYEIAVDTPGRINDAIPQDSKYRRIVH